RSRWPGVLPPVRADLRRGDGLAEARLALLTVRTRRGSVPETRTPVFGLAALLRLFHHLLASLPRLGLDLGRVHRADMPLVGHDAGQAHFRVARHLQREFHGFVTGRYAGAALSGVHVDVNIDRAIVGRHTLALL